MQIMTLKQWHIAMIEMYTGCIVTIQTLSIQITAVSDSVNNPLKISTVCPEYG